MDNPQVSVAILSEKKVNFDLYGDFRVPGFSRKFSGRFEASLENDRIIVRQDGELFNTDKELLFDPVDLDIDSFLLKNVKIGKSFHWEKRENQRFIGSLKLIKESGKITVVNILPVEDYLISVISSEMNPNASLEFLKTHAIISRSWVMAQIQKQTEKMFLSQKETQKIETEDEIIKWYDHEDHTNYNVCADDHCQRYQGIKKISGDSARKAVMETRGLVLKYDDAICDTRFSKCCGGVTEAFENVWEPKQYPYLTSVIDYKFEPDGFIVDLVKERYAKKWITDRPHAFCDTTDERILKQVLVDYDFETTNFYRWEEIYSQGELSDIIQLKSGIDFGDIIDLQPIERGYSSRIIKLKIIGTKKTLTVGKELEIRRILSKTHLYSSAFIVEKGPIENDIPKSFRLKGAGWGHGVGLCQIGAAVMSEMGYNFDEILLHYFKNVRIQRAY